MMSALLRFVGIRPTIAPTFARENLPVTQHTTQWTLQRAPRGSVLMLDIDGVLYPGQSDTLIYLPLLGTWLQIHPNVDAVISSNWREIRTLDGLRNFFSIELYERAIGCTPVLPDCTRLDEILYVVREYNVTRWTALDDRVQEFPDTRQPVATEHLDGLTGESLPQLTHVMWAAPRRYGTPYFACLVSIRRYSRPSIRAGTEPKCINGVAPVAARYWVVFSTDTRGFP